MKSVLKKIPAGWELIPVGRKITGGCRVCYHPYRQWAEMESVPSLHGGVIQSPESNVLPYGHYIRKKRAKKK